jgi:glycosyltransferase involved in cell wall biosynthesis
MKFQSQGNERSSIPKRRNVVIAAAFPPPVHGLSKISESIAADLANLADVYRYDLSARSLARSPAYHWRRAVAVLSSAAGILRNGFRRNACLYIPADGGLGLLYTFLLVALARLSGQAVVVHHHSFSAIDRHSHVMSALVAVAGKPAIHVFLCQKMQRQFRENYRGQWRSLVSSNAIHLPVASEISVRAADTIRIGLLSNLTREKGLYLFLDVLRACVRDGLAVEGRLAGPIDDMSDLAALRAAQSELGDSLIYLGPQYGEAKSGFLSELDVFLFPTIYRNEAQPNAVFEAMSAGLAVILFGRGCLDEDVSADCGLLIPPSDDFVSAALAQIASWHQNRAGLAAAKTAARQRFAALRAAAANDYETLLRTIAGRATIDH